MNEKDFRFVLWVVDLFLWVATICLMVGSRLMRKVTIDYYSIDQYNSAAWWLTIATVLALLLAAVLLAGLVISGWNDYIVWLRKTYVWCLQKVSQVALSLAAKVAPKPTRPATPVAQKPPNPPKPPPAPPKPRPDPGPPPPPAPPLPPAPRTDPPKPDPDPDPTPSRRGRGPNDDPHSGAAALPVPRPPIHRMQPA